MRDRSSSTPRRESVSRSTPAHARRRRRRRASTFIASTLGIVAALALPSLLVGATTQTASVTIVAQDLNGNPISTFTFLVSEDNAGRRTDPPSQRPGRRPTPSYIPLVAAGDQGSATVNLDSPGRYLVTVKAPGAQALGQALLASRRRRRAGRPAGEVPAEARKARRARFPRPPAGQRRARLHAARTTTASPVSKASRSASTTPSASCRPTTTATRSAAASASPTRTATSRSRTSRPAGTRSRCSRPTATDWLQTTTFEGTHLIDFAPGNRERRRARRARRGSGRRRRQDRMVVRLRAAAWSCPCDGTPVRVDHGDARRPGWAGRPYNEIYFGEPIPHSDRRPVRHRRRPRSQVYTGFGDPDGSFAIGNIPDGTYTLSIFDENLDWIIRYVTFTLPDPVTGSRDLDLNVDGRERRERRTRRALVRLALRATSSRTTGSTAPAARSQAPRPTTGSGTATPATRTAARRGSTASTSTSACATAASRPRRSPRPTLSPARAATTSTRSF